MAWLLAAEPDVADRDEVAVIVRRSREVRSWLDAIDVACARRSRGVGGGRVMPSRRSRCWVTAGSVRRVSRPSSTNGCRPVMRCRCSKRRWPPVRSPVGHVDAVAAVLVGLDDEIRSAFIAEQDALLAAARREPVEEFRRRVPQSGAVPDRPTRSAHGGADTEMAVLERQRAASRIRHWADHETGMHHTHIELDPVRGAKLNKALADMLRRHRSIEANSGVAWNQLEVDSFLAGIDRAITQHRDHDDRRRHPARRGSAGPRDRGVHRPDHPDRRAARTQHL